MRAEPDRQAQQVLTEGLNQFDVFRLRAWFLCLCPFNECWQKKLTDLKVFGLVPQRTVRFIQACNILGSGFNLNSSAPLSGAWRKVRRKWQEELIQVACQKSTTELQVR